MTHEQYQNMEINRRGCRRIKVLEMFYAEIQRKIKSKAFNNPLPLSYRLENQVFNSNVFNLQYVVFSLNHQEHWNHNEHGFIKVNY
ncbi:MAG: hypothetical protein Ta2E_10430 [Mycoplasmoidaceae bacterium]|nr:MAG: hypothetical protein Ta2E_10430 [Mycoplasmoidaceae bacterium]